MNMKFCENLETSRTSADKRFLMYVYSNAIFRVATHPSHINPKQGFCKTDCIRKVNIFLLDSIIKDNKSLLRVKKYFCCKDCKETALHRQF